MAQITAQLVKELRDKTGAGMMDCKKALTETDGDLEAGVDWLRKNGLAAAAKKAGRVASEGLVAIATDGRTGAIVEVNAETDFVARNETFQDFARTIASVTLAHGGDVEALSAAAYPGGGQSVAEKLTGLIATIGENMHIRRAETLAVKKGVLASYVHSAIAPGVGKIAVLVGLESDADAGALTALGKQIAMHVAASAPQAVDRDGLDAAMVARERKILTEQALESGKPEAIVEKMVDGRIRKFYEDNCLLEQTFAIDGESKISAVLESAAKAMGKPVTISGFRLFKLGEGIEKKSEDFAAEVAAAAGH